MLVEQSTYLKPFPPHQTRPAGPQTSIQDQKGVESRVLVGYSDEVSKITASGASPPLQSQRDRVFWHVNTGFSVSDHLFWSNIRPKKGEKQAF